VAAYRVYVCVYVVSIACRDMHCVVLRHVVLVGLGTDVTEAEKTEES
jgi:hypothetical protein